MTAAITATTPTTLQRIDDLLGKQVFFIVGCQKSGTTWVERLLNGHPDVRCHGEAYFGPVLMPLLQLHRSLLLKLLLLNLAVS